MSFNSRFPSRISLEVSLPKDEAGMIGRECPVSACLGYFKIKPGTGLTGDGLPCYCPYCGHAGPQNTFHTTDQIEYGKSVGIRKITDMLVGEMKRSLERAIPARGPFGIGLSIKVERGTPRPIRHYREKELETNVACSVCTLEYAIYGVFGFCPDCGVHNSLQILQKNLELARKEIDLAATVDTDEMREHLIGDALENVVSSFDGFGREFAARHATKASSPSQASKMSFQNLQTADDKLNELFGFRLSASVPADQWSLAIRSFQKRHLLAHKMGVVDDKYIAATNDSTAVAGRRVQIMTDEVKDALVIVGALGQALVDAIK
jgi:hypothetical protein